MVAAAAAGKPSGRVDQLQPALIAEQSQQQRATELLYVRNTISERWSQRPYFRQRKNTCAGAPHARCRRDLTYKASMNSGQQTLRQREDGSATNDRAAAARCPLPDDGFFEEGKDERKERVEPRHVG